MQQFVLDVRNAWTDSRVCTSILSALINSFTDYIHVLTAPFALLYQEINFHLHQFEKMNV